MHEWTVERHFHTGTWVLRCDGEVHQTFLRQNGSSQSSRQCCERELACRLNCDYYKDQPETGYLIARQAMKLVEKSGLTITISKAVMR